jgi:uncharacterized phage-associated protein
VPYDARLVANHFLELGQSQGAPISPLKMQKLVYLATSIANFLALVTVMAKNLFPQGDR